MNTIELLDKKECCGCGSCMQKCPKNAIRMVEDREGFFYPVIDKKLCIMCGICSKVCPQLKEVKKKKENNYPKAFAVYNKNKDELIKSSSGGVFSAIANYVLENNGIVFGAAYNDELDVMHIKIKDKKELNKIRGSKYVQSNINITYKETEEELKKGKLVLFTGTPCQVAGLNSFLIKNYNNLITCDLVCHGVPSQKLFHKYLNYLSEKFGSKVVSYDFRSKAKKGWGLISKIKTADGKIRYREPDFDPYYSNFLESNTYRENCYKCHYANYNRCSNITLADYWGIDDVHSEFSNKSGNSLILINNTKGEEVFNKIKDNLQCISTDLDIAARYNKNLIEPSKRSSKRDKIYLNIDKFSTKKYITKNLAPKITIKKILRNIIPTKIKNLLKSILKKIK